MFEFEPLISSPYRKSSWRWWTISFHESHRNMTIVMGQNGSGSRTVTLGQNISGNKDYHFGTQRERERERVLHSEHVLQTDTLFTPASFADRSCCCCCSSSSSSWTGKGSNHLRHVIHVMALGKPGVTAGAHVGIGWAYSRCSSIQGRGPEFEVNCCCSNNWNKFPNIRSQSINNISDTVIGEQWSGRVLGITGWDPSACKSNRLQADIVRFSLLNWGIFDRFL